MYLGHSKTCVFRRRRCEIYDCDTSPYLWDIWTYNIDKLEWSYNTTESDLISLNPFCYTFKVLNWTSYSCLLQVFEQNWMYCTVTLIIMLTFDYVRIRDITGSDCVCLKHIFFIVHSKIFWPHFFCDPWGGESLRRQDPFLEKAVWQRLWQRLYGNGYGKGYGIGYGIGYGKGYGTGYMAKAAAKPLAKVVAKSWEWQHPQTPLPRKLAKD